MNRFAYVRVSTREQNIDRQMAALEPYDVPKKNVFCDHQSGKNFARPAYNRLMRKLKRGDLLIIKSIDRLGRNYSEILQQWQHITKDIGADIFVIDMPLLDTQAKNGDLTGVFVADLVLQILAYVAQTEREFIHQRQAEGIAAAKAKGATFGRHPIKVPCQFDSLYAQRTDGEISLRAAADILGVSHTTFYRWCKQREKDYFVNKGRHCDTFQKA